MPEKLNTIWMDGKFVDWDDAKIHILTHSLHYGLASFEGIRAYETENGHSAVFRLKDHIKRLYDSCKIINVKIPFSFEDICKASVECLSRNNLKAGYIRPIAYIGEGVMGVFPGNNPIRVAIATWKWGTYLGEDALAKGIRAKVSSFNRYQPNTMMTRGKLTGNYSTSVLAKVEARNLGFDEAIMLDTDGYVAEGTGENIFILRNGVLKTTPLMTILPGITRDTVLTLCKDLGVQVVEQRFSRDEMYIADEVFFSGTAAEITPIREIDGRTIGNGQAGAITKKIQKYFFDVVQGKINEHLDWLTPYEISTEKKSTKSKSIAVK